MDEQPRIETTIDDRLRQLAEGSLSSQERAALEAQAAEDPNLAARLALYQPLDEAAMQRMEQTVAASSPARRRWRPPLVGGAIAAVAATSIAVAFVVPPTAAVGTYQLTVRGGRAATFRGPPMEQDDLKLMFADIPIELQVQPDVDIDVDTQLVLFARREGKWHRLSAPSTRSPAGVFRIRDTVKRVFAPAPGADRLRVVVAPKSSQVGLPPYPDEWWTSERALAWQAAPDG